MSRRKLSGLGLTTSKTFLRLFSIFRDIGYTRGVSAANPWKSTTGGALDLKRETAITLDYMRGLRDKVYKG